MNEIEIRDEFKFKISINIKQSRMHVGQLQKIADKKTTDNITVRTLTRFHFEAKNLTITYTAYASVRDKNYSHASSFFA